MNKSLVHFSFLTLVITLGATNLLYSMQRSRTYFTTPSSEEKEKAPLAPVVPEQEIINEIPTKRLQAVAYNPNTNYFVTLEGVEGNDLYVRDVKTGLQRSVLKLENRGGFIMELSPDGKKALIGFQDNSAGLVDLQTGKLLQQFIGHTMPINSVAFSPDGKTVLTGSWDHTARLWDVQTGKELKKLVGNEEVISYEEIRQVAFSPDGKIILVGLGNGARLLDAQTGTLLREFTQRGSFSKAAFSPDGETILIVYHRTAYLWNIKTGELLKEFIGATSDTNSVAFSPDGKMVLIGTTDKASLYDVKTGNPLKEFKVKKKRISFVAFNPDGKSIIVAANNSIFIEGFNL